MAEQITIARPYAEAVFEIARAEKALPAWSQLLADLVELIALPEVWQVITSPRLSSSEVTALLLEIVGDGVDARGQNLLRLLAQNRRMIVLPEILVRYEQLRAEAENTVSAEVTSARPLNEQQQQLLAEAIKSKLGREVKLTCEVDESLLGGAVVRAGDLVIDGSARGKLEKLAATLGT